MALRYLNSCTTAKKCPITVAAGKTKRSAVDLAFLSKVSNAKAN